MSLYQQHYAFRGVVFTTSSAVISLCNKYNLIVITDIQRNKFHLPIVSYMIQRMVASVDAHYYGYMNSDILFPPDVFSILSVIQGKMDAGIIPKNIGLTATVHDNQFPFENKDFSSMKNLNRVFRIGSRGIKRNMYCMVWLLIVFDIGSLYLSIHLPVLSYSSCSCRKDVCG